MTAAAVIPLPAVERWRGGSVQLAKPYQPRTGEAALVALEGLARRETPTLARHLDAALQARRDGPARRRWGVAATTWALWGLFRAGCPADEIRSAIGEAMAEQESKLRTACDRFASAAESIEPVVDAMVAAVVIGIAPEHVDAMRTTCRIAARHAGLRTDDGDKLSTEQIAEVVGVRPTVVGRWMHMLREAGQVDFDPARRQGRRYRLLVAAPAVPSIEAEERPARVPAPDGRLTVADIGELLPGAWRRPDHAAARMLCRYDRSTLERMIGEAVAARLDERPEGSRRDRLAVVQHADGSRMYWWSGHLRPAALLDLVAHVPSGRLHHHLVQAEQDVPGLRLVAYNESDDEVVYGEDLLNEFAGDDDALASGPEPDPAAVQSVVACLPAIEREFGVRLVAYTPATEEIVYGQDLIDELVDETDTQPDQAHDPLVVAISSARADGVPWELMALGPAVRARGWVGPLTGAMVQDAMRLVEAA